MTAQDVEVRFAGVSKSFVSPGGVLEVLADVDLELHRGEFVALVGPSGCGKTTLLRLAAGLARPDVGTISHRGEPCTRPPRWVGAVFQEYNRSLFPWLSVERNVGFGLSNLSRRERRRQVASALATVGLEGFGRHYPWQLSGGMQQRTALARSLVRSPSVMLLDEPFASVDAQTRAELQVLVMDLCDLSTTSVMLVTHDIEEAILMADRVLVLSDRPSRVVADLEVAIERPRDPIVTREHPSFLMLRRRIAELLKPESERTDPAPWDADRPQARDAGRVPTVVQIS